jgi:hypothetical protein
MTLSGYRSRNSFFGKAQTLLTLGLSLGSPRGTWQTPRASIADSEPPQSVSLYKNQNVLSKGEKRGEMEKPIIFAKSHDLKLSRVSYWERKEIASGT